MRQFLAVLIKLAPLTAPTYTLQSTMFLMYSDLIRNGRYTMQFSYTTNITGSIFLTYQTFNNHVFLPSIFLSSLLNSLVVNVLNTQMIHQRVISNLTTINSRTSTTRCLNFFLLVRMLRFVPSCCCSWLLSCECKLLLRQSCLFLLTDVIHNSINLILIVLQIV